MKPLALLFLAFSLSGCCTTKCLWDGKCHSWCERRNRAESLCRDHGGVKECHYGTSLCADGTQVEVDK